MKGCFASLLAVLASAQARYLLAVQVLACGVLACSDGINIILEVLILMERSVCTSKEAVLACKILACSAGACMRDTGPVSYTSICDDFNLLEMHDIDGEECLHKQGGSA